MILKAPSQEEIHSAEEILNARIEHESLTLEEIYKTVVAEKDGGFLPGLWYELEVAASRGTGSIEEHNA